MKEKLKLQCFILLAVLVLPVWTHAQGTAFSYQGHLLNQGVAPNGGYDFLFDLFDAEAAGVQVGPDVTINNAPVSDGQFNVSLDFGPGAFAGGPRWLEISLRPTGVGQFTKMAGRVALLPTPYAIFAGKAGSVADGSIGGNQLSPGAIDPTKLSVANAPTLGSVLKYDGAGFDWVDLSAASVWALNGTSAYYTAGSVGIGTANPTPGWLLEVNGNTRWTPGGSGGAVQLSTPNGETGIGVIGTSRFDLRFDGSTVKLVAGYGLGPPPPQYGITINTNGNVGVGMASPLIAFQWKLEINGSTRMTPGGTGGAIQFSTPNGETGLGFLGANRSDLRFDGSTLKLVAGVGSGPPPPENGIAITTDGNVGIGTAAPIAKLDVENAQPGKSAVFGNETGSSGVGVYGGATASSGVGVFARNLNGVAIYADGNASQGRDKAGLVKAMVYVAANGTIGRCYNGVTGASGNACGFSIQDLGLGLYGIDFGFRVDDRFASVTSGLAEEDHGTYTVYKGSTTASIVYGYQPTFIGETHPNSLYVQLTLPANFGGGPLAYYPASFTVIVY